MDLSRDSTEPGFDSVIFNDLFSPIQIAHASRGKNYSRFFLRLEQPKACHPENEEQEIPPVIKSDQPRWGQRNPNGQRKDSQDKPLAPFPRTQITFTHNDNRPVETIDCPELRKIYLLLESSTKAKTLQFLRSTRAFETGWV